MVENYTLDATSDNDILVESSTIGPHISGRYQSLLSPTADYFVAAYILFICK